MRHSTDGCMDRIGIRKTTDILFKFVGKFCSVKGCNLTHGSGYKCARMHAYVHARMHTQKEKKSSAGKRTQIKSKRKIYVAYHRGGSSSHFSRPVIDTCNLTKKERKKMREREREKQRERDRERGVRDKPCLQSGHLEATHMQTRTRTRTHTHAWVGKGAHTYTHFLLKTNVCVPPDPKTQKVGTVSMPKFT